jgi:hypothetical protein
MGRGLRLLASLPPGLCALVVEVVAARLTLAKERTVVAVVGVRWYLFLLSFLLPLRIRLLSALVGPLPTMEAALPSDLS